MSCAPTCSCCNIHGVLGEKFEDDVRCPADEFCHAARLVCRSASCEKFVLESIERVAEKCLALHREEQDIQVWYAESIAAETPVWQRKLRVVSGVIQPA